jgi:hypothetical protein
LLSLRTLQQIQDAADSLIGMLERQQTQRESHDPTTHARAANA